MDLEDVKCFLAAVDAPTFRVAASKVALSPTAFSDRIRHLEEELGCPLFHRTSRRVSITEAGRRLDGHARALLDAAAHCASVVLGETRPLPYEITVGTRFELGMSWLAPMLASLEAEQPERVIHLAFGDTPELLAQVDRGEIDAAVLSARLTRPRIAYATLHIEEYAFVAKAGTVLGAPADHTLIDVSADLPLFRYFLDAVPGAAPWRFGAHRYMGGIAGVRYLILQGVGLGVLPRYFVQDDLDSGRMVQLLPAQRLLSDNFRLVWRSGHPWGDRLAALAASMRLRPLR